MELEKKFPEESFDKKLFDYKSEIDFRGLKNLKYLLYECYFISIVYVKRIQITLN